MNDEVKKQQNSCGNILKVNLDYALPTNILKLNLDTSNNLTKITKYKNCVDWTNLLN